MLKINKVVIISFFTLTQLPLWAQNNTNSSYTRLGYGGLADWSFGTERATGGVDYRLRSSRQINPLNPASYSRMDSLAFLPDFGAPGQVSWSYGDTNKQRQMNRNVEYIAMQFPVTWCLAMSVSLLPYLCVGYDFGESHTKDGLSWGEGFSDEGGLSDAYLGLSYDIRRKCLSTGVNAGSLLGNITHSRNLIFPNLTRADDVYRNQRYEIRDLKLDFGTQYAHPLSKMEHVTVGPIYSPGKKLNTTVYDTQLAGSSAASGYTRDGTIKSYRFDTSNSYGVGISYVKENRLTLAADFLYEDWMNAYFGSEKGQLKDRTRAAAGAEFILRYDNRSYLGHARYRAGFHYSNLYLGISRSEENGYRGHGYNEYGTGVDFGLSLADNRSLVNLSFEYMKICPELRTIIDEQHFRLTVNYTFNEL